MYEMAQDSVTPFIVTIDKEREEIMLPLQNMILLSIVAIAVILLIVLLAMGYVKAPPDRAFIISGPHKKPRYLIGRAGFKIPFLERVDTLYLGQMSVDIKTETAVPTNDFINVNVDAIAKIRIITDRQVNVGTDEKPMLVDGLQLAAKNFLNMDPNRIASELQDSLQGNMREIIGTLDIRSINTDRDSFSDQVMNKASKDMEKLGIEIISCNIQNVTDENGLIKDLGADNTSKIKKDAAIAKANADKEVAIAQAETDTEANKAQVAAQTEIAQRDNDLAIKKAELLTQSETKRAAAEAAYKIESQIQQKEIETQTVNASIAKAEREAELRRQEVAVKEQELTAEVEKKADADKYQAERVAEAELIQRQKAAEAARYQAEQEAAGIRAKGEAEAAATKMKAEAEAAGIRAKGLAEAEAMDKKAEAYKKYNNAAIVEMMVNILPQMAQAIANPVGQIDKINVYATGGENGDGVSSISGVTPVVMKQVFDTVKESTGVDLADVMRANTYDAKVNRNINVSGLPDDVSEIVKNNTAGSDKNNAES